MLSGIKSLSQKHQSSVVLWPACLRCPIFSCRGFLVHGFLFLLALINWKKTKPGRDLLCRCRLLWFTRSIYLITPFYVCLGNKSICDQIGITTIIYINTNKMLHTTPQTPHGHTLISHFPHISIGSAWDHILKPTNLPSRLMKATVKTAAFHMWFNLMSHPECLTLSGNATFCYSQSSLSSH